MDAVQSQGKISTAQTKSSQSVKRNKALLYTTTSPFDSKVLSLANIRATKTLEWKQRSNDIGDGGDIGDDGDGGDGGDDGEETYL